MAQFQQNIQYTQDDQQRSSYQLNSNNQANVQNKINQQNSQNIQQNYGNKHDITLQNGMIGVSDEGNTKNIKDEDIEFTDKIFYEIQNVFNNSVIILLII